jgi:hypothetical protein
MRRRVALLTMAMGVVVAGNARAHDATQVIYDLSSIQPTRVAASAPRSQHEVALPSVGSPISSPSFEPGEPQLGDLELRRQPGPGLGSVSVGSPRQGGQDTGGQNDPSPTPEPGSMLLLGGALAAGARRWARRRA